MNTTKQMNAHELIQATKKALRETKYTELSMRIPEMVWRNLEEYLQNKDIHEYSHEVGTTFLEERYKYSSNPTLESNKDRMRAIQMLTDFQMHEKILIRKVGIRREFAEPFRTTFHAFMESRKNAGISNRTLETYVIYLDRFSCYLVDQSITQVVEINVSHIHGFIQFTATTHRTSTVYCTSCALRVLFRYLYEQELTPTNLSPFVSRVKCSKKSKIPSAYSQEEIQQMLSVIDRGNPKGKRDYAMLLIAVRLGMRSSDICKLSFNDLKWESNTIEFIQGKTKEKIVLPLLNDVGEAVIDYMKYGRPIVDDKEIFLRLSAPVGPMSAPTLHSIVSQYLNKAGISIPQGKKHGPHALRHSLASALLQNNVPMPVISEVLGHSDTDTTSVYLKIDILHLRNYALDVPQVKPVLFGEVFE